jgi:hypothetical protein
VIENGPVEIVDLPFYPLKMVDLSTVMGFQWDLMGYY